MPDQHSTLRVVPAHPTMPQESKSVKSLLPQESKSVKSLLQAILQLINQYAAAAEGILRAAHAVATCVKQVLASGVPC